MVRFALCPSDADEYDVAEETSVLERAKIDPAWCLVSGLSSEAGQQLNGKVGRAEVGTDEINAAAPDDRISVRLVDNEDITKSVKRKNLEFALCSRDTTGSGICVVTYNPLGSSSIAYSRWSTDSGPSLGAIGKIDDRIPFFTFDDLPVPLQFLLACGAIPNLQRAQVALQRMADGNCRALPMSMRSDNVLAAMPADATKAATQASEVEVEAVAAAAAEEEEEEEYDSNAEYDDDEEEVIFTPPSAVGSAPPAPAPASEPAAAVVPSSRELAEMHVPECTVIPGTLLALGAAATGLARLRVPGAGMTALEWAAKRGNMEIVQWLCTDERTKELLHAGSPVGWACYGGHVEVARYLVGRGGDPRATDSVLWRGLPPVMAAAVNGKVGTLEFCVCECNPRISVNTTDEQGLGILYKIRQVSEYKLTPGLVAVEEWSLAHGCKEQYLKWK